MTYVVYTSAVTAQSDADAIWIKYRDARIAALGRKPGDSIDSFRDGRPAPAVTRAYCKPYVASPTLAAIPVDASVSAAIDTKTAVDETALPAALKTIIAPAPKLTTAVVAEQIA